MKKFLALLLSLAVAMGASPAILAAEEQVQPLPTCAGRWICYGTFW